MVKNAITVFARIKPEKSEKGIANYQIHRRPKKHSKEDFLVLTAPQKFSDYIDNRPESWNFSFHKIFSHDVTQDDIFKNVARPIIDSVFEGYNATIFAYGQTGSGKTYTITGEPRLDTDRGILPRTFQYIFQTIRKNPENLYSVEVAYLEIYNENGYDLLLERKQREAATRIEDLPRVSIQENENGTIHLKNLSFRIVENENEALQFLLDGDNYRAVSETPMNPRSSRSHCIFTIVLSVKKFGTDCYRSAKMHLVDLAGSERVYKCSIQGTILTEAKHINLSLHFLEQVIVSLGQENVSHVPYRNSLLTSILRDSLGGNCLTTMLANLSVSNFNLEETISTCRFAQRVALVKNDVNLTLQLDTRSENKLLKMENERLRMEIEELKKNHFAPSSLSTESLEYYKKLVIQRDQEISRLIEILKKKSSTKETRVSRHEKSTQIPRGDISPRKSDESSPKKRKSRRKSFDSLHGKKATSPKGCDVTSLKIKPEIKSRRKSPKMKIPRVPLLDLENNDSEINSSPEKETFRLDDNHSEGKTETEKFEELKKCENSELTNNSSQKKSSREMNPAFPDDVIEAIKTTRNNQSDEKTEIIIPKSVTPKCTSGAANILQNTSRVEKNSDTEKNVSADETSSEVKNNNDRIDEDFGKLPLTGDPEIDEEIIAFYKAKRGGGSY